MKMFGISWQIMNLGTIQLFDRVFIWCKFLCLCACNTYKMLAPYLLCFLWSTWWRHQMEPFSPLLALCAGNSPVQVNSPHKGQWRGALMFSLICAWINDWVNNREAGDLRHHRGHYDVNVMRQPSLSGVPDLFDRNKILRCVDLSHYQVPYCIRVFFYFVWFVFIHHTFQYHFELCTYCNILDIYLS